MNKIAKAKHRLLHGKIPAYIHIPKTGGTYLGQIESSKNPVISPIHYLGHCAIVEKGIIEKNYPPSSFQNSEIFIKEDLQKNRIFFTTVRNIYDWLVSYWYHSGGVKNTYQSDEHYDFNLSQKGFDDFVRAIAERDGDVWPSKKIIFFQTFSYQGEFLPEWVSRTNTLDKDIEEFAKIKKLKYKKKKKQRVSGRKKHFADHYSKSLKKLVEKTWKREMDLFGFSFDDREIIGGFFDRNISKDQASRVKYIYHQDNLYVDGKLVK